VFGYQTMFSDRTMFGGGHVYPTTTINVTEKCMQTIRPKKDHFIHTSPWVAPKESNIVIEG